MAVRVSSVATDAALLDGIAQNQPDALGALYDRYGAFVFALALRLTADSTAACLVTEAVFHHVWSTPTQITLTHNRCSLWLIEATAQHAASYHIRPEMLL